MSAKNEQFDMTNGGSDCGKGQNNYTDWTKWFRWNIMGEKFWKQDTWDFDKKINDIENLGFFD